MKDNNDLYKFLVCLVVSYGDLSPDSWIARFASGDFDDTTLADLIKQVNQETSKKNQEAIMKALEEDNKKVLLQMKLESMIVRNVDGTYHPNREKFLW